MLQVVRLCPPPADYGGLPDIPVLSHAVGVVEGMARWKPALQLLAILGTKKK